MEDIARNEQIGYNFKRVTNDVVSVFHKPGPNKDPYSPVVEMINAPVGSHDEQQSRSAHGDHFLRSIAFELVHGPKPTHGDDQSQFIGPMAVQLGRRDLQTLHDHAYYITEKSDGIRVMMLSLYEKKMFRWLRKVIPIPQQQQQQSQTSYYVPLSLCDNCAIEVTYKHMCQKKKDSLVINLSMGSFTMLIENSRDERSQHVIPRAKLRPTQQEQQETEILLRREVGWTFNYFFDRTFQFYMSLEEFVFPTLQTKLLKLQIPEIQRVCLLDGEIVRNIPEQKFNFTVYDVVTMCVSEKVVPETRPPTFKCIARRMVTEPMDRRIFAITENIVEAHHYYNHRFAREQSPKSLVVVRKKFYTKQEVEAVSRAIRKDQSGRYVYKEYNYNDGLVFTPLSPEMFKFQPGTSKYLLKWKWPDKLTADFLIVPQEEEEPYNKESGYQNVPVNNCSMYFSTNKMHAFYKQTYLHGMSQELRSKESFVAECALNSNTGQWHIEVVRNDKDYANAFKTIAYTMENMLENITIEDLKRACLPSSVTGVSGNNVGGLAKPSKEELQLLSYLKKNKIFTHFRVKTNKDRGSTLQLVIPPNYVIPRAPQYEIIVNHVQVSDCLGPQNETGAALEALIKERRMPLAACMYIPYKGRWKVIRLHDQIHQGITTMGFLEYLEKVICLQYQAKHNPNALQTITVPEQQEDKYIPSNFHELPKHDDEFTISDETTALEEQQPKEVAKIQHSLENSHQQVYAPESSLVTAVNINQQQHHHREEEIDVYHGSQQQEQQLQQHQQEQYQQQQHSDYDQYTGEPTTTMGYDQYTGAQLPSHPIGSSNYGEDEIPEEE